MEPAGFAILRKLAPVRPENRLSPEENKDLESKYKKWLWLELALLFTFGPPFGFAWFWLFRSLTLWVNSSRRPALILLSPYPIFWGVPSILLGVISTAPLILVIFKKFLGDRFDEFQRWDNARFGIDGKKAASIMVIFIFAFTAFMLVVGLRSYTAFGEKGFSYQGPFSARVDYPYSRVKDIAKVSLVRAPIRTIIERTHYAIRFDDGFTWTTETFPDEADEECEREITALVTAQSGRAVRDVGFIEELGP
jgi:hypothetical protein